MSDLKAIFDAGAADAALFIPSAVALGALHGLEPGHSKTMMAAFIVAIRGTVTQAVLLGVAATVSHTAVVWLIALTGLYFGSQWRAESSEPYLQLASGLLMLLVAAWMGLSLWRARGGAQIFAAMPHDHDHDGHGHDHDDHHHPHHHHAHDEEDHREHAQVEQQARQDHHHRNFGLPRRRPPQHAPRAKEARFKQELIHANREVFADAHEREHALEINRRFGDGRATTAQIVLFGLTGGLIPCAGSITVLVLCLQVGKVWLGALLVLCFSVGLAMTLVLVGVAAALSLRHAGARWKGLSVIAAKAPYLSAAIVGLIGVYTLYLGYSGLA
ncbi:MAG TPA: nickel/cobalt efflux transporter [Methylocystis sp.]|nr:nickel/cobalt efflux transporter [Methylocystis sp.]